MRKRVVRRRSGRKREIRTGISQNRMRGGVLYAAEVPLKKPVWRVIFRTPSHGVLAATGFEDYKSRKKAEQRLKWLKKNGYIAKLVKVETKEVISEE